MDARAGTAMDPVKKQKNAVKRMSRGAVFIDYLQSYHLPGRKSSGQADQGGDQQDHAEYAKKSWGLGCHQPGVQSLSHEVSEQATWKEPELVDELEVNAHDQKRDHLDDHQDEPQHEEGVAQLMFGHMVCKDGDDQRRASQGGATDIAAQAKQDSLNPGILALKSAIENVSHGIDRDDGKDHGADDLRRNGEQADHPNQLGDGHDLEGLPEVGPVDVAGCATQCLGLAIPPPGDPARENQKVNGNRGQKQQRIIDHQKKEWERQDRATKPKPASHKTTPDEDEPDEGQLGEGELSHLLGQDGVATAGEVVLQVELKQHRFKDGSDEPRLTLERRAQAVCSEADRKHLGLCDRREASHAANED